MWVVPRACSPETTDDEIGFVKVLPRTRGFTGPDAASDPSCRGSSAHARVCRASTYGRWSLFRFFRASAGSPTEVVSTIDVIAGPSAHARVHRPRSSRPSMSLQFFRARAGSPTLVAVIVSAPMVLPRPRGFTAEHCDRQHKCNGSSAPARVHPMR
jgi:hypothetical protein